MEGQNRLGADIYRSSALPPRCTGGEAEVQARGGTGRRPDACPPAEAPLPWLLLRPGSTSASASMQCRRSSDGAPAACPQAGMRRWGGADPPALTPRGHEPVPVLAQGWVPQGDTCRAMTGACVIWYTPRPDPFPEPVWMDSQGAQIPGTAAHRRPCSPSRPQGTVRTADRRAATHAVSPPTADVQGTLPGPCHSIGQAHCPPGHVRSRRANSGHLPPRYTGRARRHEVWEGGCHRPFGVTPTRDDGISIQNPRDGSHRPLAFRISVLPLRKPGCWERLMTRLLLIPTVCGLHPAARRRRRP